MVIINLSESDMLYFNDIIKNNPDSTDVAPIKGLDGNNYVQIIIDIALALSSQFLTALGIFLNYKAAKRQEQLKLMELNANETDETDNVNKKDVFELKVLFGSQKLMYSNDSLEKEQADEIIKKIMNLLSKQ